MNETLSINKYKPRAEVTLQQRMEASEIIKSLRKAIKRPNRKVIAEQIGIKPIYVSTIDKMHKDRIGRYFAPGEAIVAVLKWSGEANG